MKRFWLGMLSLGLVMALSVSAFALEVKFSGTYFVGSMYLDKTTLSKDTAVDGPSTAFYFQRLRVRTDFIASPDLSLVTRFDAMERVWGANRSAPGTATANLSVATKAEKENIAFDVAYLNYISPYGRVVVGAALGGVFGTVFGDSLGCAWKIQHFTPVMNGWQIISAVQKMADGSYSPTNPTASKADTDYDAYTIAVIYTSRNWEAGLMPVYYRSALGRSNATPDNGYTTLIYELDPYFKGRIGPLKVQAELIYLWGKLKKYDNPSNTDIDIDSLGWFLDATADFGTVYVGGTFAYAQGQGTNPNKSNTIVTGGQDWSPTLVMWGRDRSDWFGSLTSAPVATAGFGNTGVGNAYFYQIRGGVKPNNKLDVMASLTNAIADTTPAGYVSKNYGYEVDVIGTYKITDNLTYMLGVGYLFTGDFFKGASTTANVTNDYMVINKLTLNF